MNQELDQKLLVSFVSEAKGYLPEIVLGLEIFSEDMEQTDKIKDALRHTHVIKGAAALLGLNHISEQAYQLEVMLDMLCVTPNALTRETLDSLCHAIVEIADALDLLLSPAAEDAGLVVSPIRAFNVQSKPDDEEESYTSAWDVSVTSTVAFDNLSPATEQEDNYESTSAWQVSPTQIVEAELPSADASTKEIELAYEVNAPAIALTEHQAEQHETISFGLPSLTDISATEPVEEMSVPPVIGMPDFAVSVPENNGSVTIGELDLNEVAADLKESYGHQPLPPQPEFEIPQELMETSLDLSPQLTPIPTAETAADDLPHPARMSAPDEDEDSLLEVPHTNADEYSYDDPADDLADNLLGDLPESLAKTELSGSGDLQTDTVAVQNDDSPSAADPLEATPLLTGDLLGASELLMAEGSESTPATMETAVAETTANAPAEATESIDLFAHLPSIGTELESTSDEALAPSTAALSKASTAAPPADEDSADVIAEQETTTLSQQFATSTEVTLELLETFLLETEDHLNNMHAWLSTLEQDVNNRDLIQALLRSSHSLKGTSAIVGFRNITQLSHRMEDLLDLIFDGGMKPTIELIQLLMRATDTLEDMSNGFNNEEILSQLYQDFGQVLQHCEVESSAPQYQNTEDESVVLAENEAPDYLGVTTSDEPEDVLGLNAAPSLKVKGGEMLPSLMTESAPVLESHVEPTNLPSGELSPTMQTPSAFDEMEYVMKTSASELTHSIVEERQILFPATATESETAPLLNNKTSIEVALPATANALTQAPTQYVRIPIERLDELVKLLGEMVLTRTSFEQCLTDLTHQVEELQSTGTRLQRASGSLEMKGRDNPLAHPALNNGKVPAAVIASADGKAIPGETCVPGSERLQADRYNEFQLLTRDLVESSSDIQTVSRELNHLSSDFLSYLNRQSRIYCDLQDRLMRLRMVPLSNLAPRLQHAVRTLKTQQAKEVEFVIEGVNTAIDTIALMEISDSLLHLLRNAVDHGVESAQERLSKGKPAAGKITLRAFHEGPQVVLQMSDDGNGLDCNKLRAAALKAGLVDAATANSMSEQELWSLIFIPGLSTATKVSEISGRGVGMDVVQNAIQKLRGTIAIDSKAGQGTTFTIRLPLTFAVLRSLMIQALEQTFAIPLEVVTRIMRIEMNQVQYINQEPFLPVGAKNYPVLMLSRLINLKAANHQPIARPPVLLLNTEGKEIALIIDQVIGGREIVVKTLGNHLRNIHGVLGATLMSDGKVVLILNMAELIRGLHQATIPCSANHTATLQAESPSAQAESAVPASPLLTDKTTNKSKTLTVMVVDDSPSVRRLCSDLIKNAGWLTVPAKDGLDALEQLQSSKAAPDLLLLDIEMPRMDGYQLLSSIRAMPNWRNLPVVIISSRATDKHRQKALDLGATEFLVKPFQEDTLIALIQRLTS